jgi:hypothetical protein
MMHRALTRNHGQHQARRSTDLLTGESASVVRQPRVLQVRTNDNDSNEQIGIDIIGTVTTSPAWPFVNGSGLNSRYKGDLFFKIQFNGTSGGCLSTVIGGVHNGTGVLGPCNANGVAQVYNNGYNINVYWSNQADAPAFVCGDSNLGAQIELNEIFGPAGVCQWD